MNAFSFDIELKKLVMAKNFWVVVVTWIPVTLLTGLGYIFVVRMVKPKRKNCADDAASLALSSSWNKVCQMSIPKIEA